MEGKAAVLRRWEGVWGVRGGRGQGGNAVEKIERRNCDLGLDCKLTHGSPGEEGVYAPAARAGFGPSLRPGPASGEPSSACGSHRWSSLQEKRRTKVRKERMENRVEDRAGVLHCPLVSLYSQYIQATPCCSVVHSIYSTMHR